ncbi:SDR family NAD(P)-dependent oxidoreductase [Glycocaulis abyssi]|uniref:SDR family NAD(P)-dependent oxidoreductase n=1 Tax=Glycocaulis abyssi TaxID=1433403 RepID=A0ABV9NCX5_9PROT
MKPASSRPGRSGVVTGAGAGLGREIALGLASRGYIIFGTAASLEEAQELKEASAGRVSLMVCDRTSAVAVDAWACGVADALGPAGLDLLVSTAGEYARGPVEALAQDALRRVFEMNVFGALAVINAYLPALRSARGRIVQITGWAGRVPLAFDGPSGASGAAIEAFSALYRTELKPFGIDVTLVRLGALKNDERISPDSAALPRQYRKLYGKAFRTASGRLEAIQAAGMDAASAAARIIDIAHGDAPASRVAVGTDAERMMLAACDMTEAELDSYLLEIIGLS